MKGRWDITKVLVSGCHQDSERTIGIAEMMLDADAFRRPSGTEACWFDQSHLVAAGGEFPTLVALNDHTTS